MFYPDPSILRPPLRSKSGRRRPCRHWVTLLNKHLRGLRYTTGRLL
jgi:hypothetical protein